ncbi:MAG: acetyl-CoA carboxylase carboxyltransferase subunit alpha [Phycisphaeraceae bacterium]|nr:acetyl-CoA carboxylase carboxyltransferase subunit alpha [Phycisphaeraceae bacterium]
MLLTMSSFYQLDFERPIRDLEQQIEAAEARLKAASAGTEIVGVPPGVVANLDEIDAVPAADLPGHIESLKAKLSETTRKLYDNLSPWDTVRVARHPQRPQTRDYIQFMCKDFCELHGDRRFGDDPAIVTGFARIDSFKVLVVGHHKGRTTQEKIACHFGCAHPEGYRKALAKMQMAEKFGVPIVTLVDTPGAYPGLGAEQRGQAEAIAVNLREMSRLKTPIISVVIGEGGSGGALGIAVADRVAMMQNAWYSVISPEGCAAILWKTANEQTNTAAARALKLTARDNLGLGIVDDVVQEPVGGAHRNPAAAADLLKAWIVSQLGTLKGVSGDDLIARRYERFRKLGAFQETLEEAVAAEAR